MSKWTPKTYADIEGVPPGTMVQCPHARCRRKERADMLVDATMQPPELRRSGEKYHCSVCRERLFASGRVTREEYYARHNPPPQLIEKMKNIQRSLHSGR